jgi:3-deoxy-D-manno-octulosonic-acid transferase
MILYSTLLTAGVLGGAPIWAGLMASRPKHRVGFLQKASGRLPLREQPNRKPIWYHAVSLGEVIASIPLIESIYDAFPGRPIWISTVTGTGQATARSRVPYASGVFYFPYDLPWIVDRVIRSLKPALFVSAETEIWPNCLLRLQSYGVPMALVNGRISDRSFHYYRHFRFFFGPVVRCFDSLCMQSEESARRIRVIGASDEKITVTGNLKFDQPLPEAADRGHWRALLGLDNSGPIWVAGSTHSGEEEIILEVFARLRDKYPGLKLILAPRAPERFDEVERGIIKTGRSVRRRSEGGRDRRADVVLLDTIGELAKVYGLADVGFVGGSLIPHGGHNPLEVAAHGCPVIYGPHMENFREITALLRQNGGGMVARNPQELEQCVDKCLSEPIEGGGMGQKALETFASNRGAVKRTLESLKPLLGAQG